MSPILLVKGGFLAANQLKRLRKPSKDAPLSPLSSPRRAVCVNDTFLRRCNQFDKPPSDVDILVNKGEVKTVVAAERLGDVIRVRLDEPGIEGAYEWYVDEGDWQEEKEVVATPQPARIYHDLPNVTYYIQHNNETDVFGPGSRQCATSSNAMAYNYKKDFALDKLSRENGGADPESFYDNHAAKYADTIYHDGHTKALRDLGMESYWSTSLDFEDLRASLAADCPIVIAVKYKKSGHVMVVVGEEPGAFIVHDPYGVRKGASNHYNVWASGERDKYSYELMEQLWVPGKGWGRIITSVGGEKTGL